jgi:multiple sugar transport system substrate-binding protein
MSETKFVLNRRDFLRGASALAVGSVLAACGPTPAPPATEAPKAAPAEATPTAAPAPAGVTVQYWFGWGGTYAIQTWDALKATDEFKQAIGNNTLETKGSAGDAVTTAVAAGTPPDGASNIQYLDYMARDVLVPITDWVAASSLVKKESYLEGTWNDAFYKGVMYGVPGNEGFLRYGLNYNSKLVEAAGLDPKNPPQTWSEVLEWHKKLTKFDEAGNLKQFGLDPFDAMGGQIGIQDGFYPPVSWGWKWFDADTGKFDLDNDKMAESFDVMGEFYKIVGPDKMAGMRQVEGQGTWGGSYNTEIQAMIIEGYWHPGESMIEKPEVGKYNMATWAPVPDSRKGVKVQGYGGHYVIIFKDSKNKEAMFKVAEFLNTNKACEVIFKNVGWLPGLKPYLQTVDPKTYPGLDFYFKSVTEATEFSSPARCPITNFTSTQYQELREKVYREQMTGKEAAAEFQKRCDTEYKQAGFGA